MPPLQVVATAGHVDHGKSSLIVRLTGIDPDRWAEEKRRGLTIDLGFAWTTLPSGNEVGFVDVPGHERFVRNMLAGVGPVRLVLFVVAADEGWKPQSEEHLAIVDVLGAADGVVALTKSDLVESSALATREREIRERLTDTTLEHAPIVACSATTGDGIDELVAALDLMIANAPTPEDGGRPRIHIDRSFTIKGAGTVVTGTLTGGDLMVGQEVTILPSGSVARVRSLQTHRRALDVARPISRVAANLSGVSREGAERGDVLVLPGQWRPTSTIDIVLRPVRSVAHQVTARGAYKLYAGTAERDAKLRLHERDSIGSGDEAFARLRLSVPIVVAAGDRFVLREAGRRATVAGGVILDPHPPGRAGADIVARLESRLKATPDLLPAIIVAERGAIRASELAALTGARVTSVPDATPHDGWWIADPLRRDLEETTMAILDAFHRSNALRPGMDSGELRRAVVDSAPGHAPSEEVLAAILVSLEREGVLARRGTIFHLARHVVSLGERQPEADRLVGLIAEQEPTPPTQRELQDQGFPRELIDACVSTGLLARVSPDVVVTPGLLARAEALVRAEAKGGLTVSRFRELLGTTRKYALPILGSFDERGITRRDGDVRRLRD